MGRDKVRAAGERESRRVDLVGRAGLCQTGTSWSKIGKGFADAEANSGNGDELGRYAVGGRGGLILLEG